MPKSDPKNRLFRFDGPTPDSGVMLRPWTLKHPAFVTLTNRSKLAYIELLAETGHLGGTVSDSYLQHLIRKDHRGALLVAGLLVDNEDGTHTVIQPADAYTPIRATT